jgi:hypothetical protein
LPTPTVTVTVTPTVESDSESLLTVESRGCVSRAHQRREGGGSIRATTVRASARQSHCQVATRPARGWPGSESAPRFNLPVPVSFFTGTQGASVFAAGEFDCGPVQAPRLAPAEHLNRVPLADH